MSNAEMELLYEKYKNSVYRLAFSYCKNTADAEDITQETFFRRFTSDIKFSDEKSEKAWLMKVTANRCKDLLKSLTYKYFYYSVSLEEANLIYETPEESAVYHAVMELPPKYRIEVSERCGKEILGRRKKRIKLSKRGIAVTVAAAVAMCGGTAVFAADRLDAFDKLRNIGERIVTTDDGREFSINKFERKDYEKISDNAEILVEPVTEDTENISISVDSVYCDSRTIILGITGSLADGNPENYGYINLAPELEINGRIYSYDHSCLANANGYMVLDEGMTNSFTGSITFILVEDEKITEPTEITIHMNDIGCSEIYFTDRVSIGGMTLTTTVTPDTSLLNNCNIFKSEDGFTATIYNISPTMMTVNYSYPIEYDLNEETLEIEEGGRMIEIPKYSLFTMWYDADGNRLNHLEMTVDMGNNIYAECIESPTTDTVIVKFCNKQQADENDMPVVVKEMTVDLKSAE